MVFVFMLTYAGLYFVELYRGGRMALSESFNATAPRTSDSCPQRSSSTSSKVRWNPSPISATGEKFRDVRKPLRAQEVISASTRLAQLKAFVLPPEYKEYICEGIKKATKDYLELFKPADGRTRTSGFNSYRAQIFHELAMNNVPNVISFSSPDREDTIKTYARGSNNITVLNDQIISDTNFRVYYDDNDIRRGHCALVDSGHIKYIGFNKAHIDSERSFVEALAHETTHHMEIMLGNQYGRDKQGMSDSFLEAGAYFHKLHRSDEYIEEHTTLHLAQANERMAREAADAAAHAYDEYFHSHLD